METAWSKRATGICNSDIAGDARVALEKKTKVKVSTKENYKEIPEKKRKRLKQKS